jgi:hypothetical protein
LNLPIEWLSFSKLIPAGSSAVKSIYDRIIGKAPRLNFDAGSGGLELHIFNTRDETIIVERIDALPPLLGFSAGDEIGDVVRAVVAQRGHRSERPIAILSPATEIAINVMTFDPFQTSKEDQLIKVRTYWRTTTRKMFSRSSVASTISVRDIKDIKIAVDRKQPRLRSF